MAKKQFGEYLRTERDKRGWSQGQLAEKLDTSVKTISRWENNETFPTPRFQKGLQEAFGKDLTAEFILRKALVSWHLPPPNPFFTGRKAIFSSIRNALDTGRTTIVLSGLGGIGKTQIAIAYAHRFLEDYQYVFWTVADSPKTLLVELIRIATALDLPEKVEKDHNVVEEAVRTWLYTHNDWLLILDNVEDPDLVERYRPWSGQGHLLVTTQDSRAFVDSHDLSIIEIESLEKQAGIHLLLRRIGAMTRKGASSEVAQTEREAASSIVEEVGGMPLALDQAGAYIHETQCGLQDYLRLFRTHKTNLLGRRGRLTTLHSASVVATISMACEKILSTPHALDLLTFCAFLHADNIPEEFFTQGAAENEALFPLSDTAHFLLTEVSGALLRYSLIHRNPTTTTISIHRLVQEVLRSRLEDAVQRQWAERVVQVASCSCWPFDHQNWQRYQRYIAHAQTCAMWIEKWQIESEEAARLLESTGYYLHERAQSEEAASLFKRVLDIRTHIWKLDSLTIAESQFNLGVVYHDLGKYSEAEIYLLGAFAVFMLASKHRNHQLSVAASMLGEVYLAEEKYVQAEKYLVLSLRYHPNVSRVPDLQIASIQHHLARVYSALGMYNAARELFRTSLKVREQLLGVSDTLVAESMEGLATLHLSLNSSEEALPLFEQALAIREQVFGMDHPNVAQSLNSLARLYYSRDELVKAEPLFKRALAIRQGVLRPEHPDLAESLHNLGTLYLAQDRLVEAETLLLQALAIREKLYGSGRLDVAQSCIVLTQLYAKQGRQIEAATYLQRASNIVDDSMEESPTIRAVQMNICILGMMGLEDEAKDLAQRLNAMIEPDQEENTDR